MANLRTFQRLGGQDPCSPTPRAGRGPRRGGFSLAELLISIGILSIGLSMSAMLFPAALKESERSMSNVLGTLICENILGLGKTVLTADNPNGGGSWDIENTVLQDKTAALGTGCSYPAGQNAGTYKLGGVLLARKLSEGSYQLMAVGYRKTTATNSVAVKPLSSVTVSGTTVTSAGLLVGSPLILQDTGEFAKIVSVSGNTGTLDHPFSSNFSGKACWVIQEGTLSASPAIWTLTTKTGLRMIR